MPKRFIFIFFSFLLVEFYSYIAVQTATRGCSKGIRFSILAIYIILTLGLWFGTLNFRTLALTNSDGIINRYAIIFLLGFILVKIIMASLMMIGDVTRLFQYIVLQFKPKNIDNSLDENTISRSSFLAKSALALGGIMFGSLLYGTLNKYNYQVKKIKLKFPHFPKAFNGLKVIQISDIHSGSFDDKESVERGVQLILDQKPDLILFTGDIVNEINTELIPFKKIFAQLNAPLGVHAVLGNHDYGDYHNWKNKQDKIENLQQLKQHFKDLNWNLMLNSYQIFEKDNEKIALIGVENWSAKNSFPKYGKLNLATQNLTQEKPDFQILMSHDPSHWDAEIKPKYPNVDLTLSGHTHGMQFGIRLPWMKWSPVQYMYQQWIGLYKSGKQYLYVNPGFGFIGYKGRVGIMPEITVFELHNG